MADFVAVIRRTVDGLSDNSPEMRSRVYEKARGAVRRQLESMKPRPSDEMIERQMGKLEAAITDVEASNAEALPEEALVQDVPADVHFEQPPVPYDVSSVEQGPAEIAPVAEEPVAPEPAEVEADEPYEPVPAAEEPFVEGPAGAPDEPAYDEVAPQDTGETVAVEAEQVPEPVELAEPEPPYIEEASVEPQQAVEHWSETPAEDRPDADQDAPGAPSAEYAPIYEQTYVEAAPVDDDDTIAVQNDPADPVAEPAADDADVDEDRPEAVEPEPEPLDEVIYTPVPETVALEPVAPVYQEPHDLEPEYVQPDEPEHREPEPEAPSLPVASWELPEWTDPTPERSEPVPATSEIFAPEPVTPVTAHIEPVWTESVDDADAADEFADRARADLEPLVVPVASGGLTPDGEISHSWALDETDPFQHDGKPDSVEPAVSDWSWPVDRSAEAERGDVPNDDPPAPASWDEIDSLLVAGGAATAAQSLSPDLAPQPPRPTSYRAEPRKSAFSIKRIATVLLLLLILGGGGYSYWMNREALNGWVSDLVASLNTAPPQTTNGPTSASGGAASGTTATGNATTDVAALDSANKFTQRLQTDGSEIDEGAAPPPAGSVTAQEGKSVAAQTEASRPVDTADAAAATTTPATPGAAATEPGATTPATTAPAVSTPPAVSPTTAPDQATTQMPAGAQKMFLYEERLGQTAPTAIEGGVAWSLKEEAPEAGQRPEPVIQAQITVPDRGLTALMTIKRNTDTSLPASHTIEFVFSLPENFEGGSIDSVQRVAMKRNEQDRGDPLIAVPAKITDDFHMIALNDFPEAVTTNLDLLRTRSWIDIPLTYRNGRRALLTLEKGAAGNDAFTKALAAWSQARPAGQ